MADTSKYTIEERLIVSVWVREKNELTKRTKKSENFFLRFNKAAPSEANLREAPTSQRATTGYGPT